MASIPYLALVALVALVALLPCGVILLHNGAREEAMLERLTVRNFKSLRDVTVELPRLSVLFGPNAAGKSNLLDAIEALSWLGNARTLSDALGGPLPVRGHSIEAFCFAAEGLPALLKRGTARFMLEADLTT